MKVEYDHYCLLITVKITDKDYKNKQLKEAFEIIAEGRGILFPELKMYKIPYNKDILQRLNNVLLKVSEKKEVEIETLF